MMDDFLVDEEDLTQLLISPSGSDFDALCTLNPPSPILTPSQLTFAWSSGDIPVLLYDEDYVDPLSELSDSSTSHDAARSKRDSSATLRSAKSTADAALNSHTLQSCRSSTFSLSLAGPAPGILGSAESSTSVDSMGTFGPQLSRRRTVRPGQVAWNSVASQSMITPDSPNPNSQNSPAVDKSDERCGAVQNQDPPPASKLSRRALSGTFYHPVVFVDAKPSRKSNLEDTSFSSSHPVGEASADGLHAAQIVSEIESLENSDEDEADRTMSPTKASAETVPWIFSQGQYNDFVPQKNLARHPQSTQVVEPDDIEDNAFLHVSSPRRKVVERHDRHVQDVDHSSLARAPHHTGQPHYRERPVNLVNQAHPERSLSSAPGLENDWLHDIYVQFLIDQEGFRAANPFFTFAGIVRLRSSQNLRAAGGATMARFKPITRQAFHFHYAPFETPPTLRRITVNGDDTHDYVSKQALLALKTNGVYILQGHEIQVSVSNNNLNNHHDAEPIKLHWQFEYLVDNRVADASGRVIEGEKILTPLTFSCSPALLLPQQAKRNSIMHVFKKGVAPKLVAEKFHPPGVPNVASKGPTLEPLPPPSSQTEAHLSGFFSSKSHGWGLHRRGQSYGVRRAEKGSPTRVAPLPGNYNSVQDRDGAVLDIKPLNLDARSTILHRRRNSSAESPMQLHFSNIGNAGTKHRREVSSAQRFSPSRHIIPPAKLSKLLDTAATKENVAAPQLVIPQVAPDRNSSGFAPLTPRPRHGKMKSRDHF